MQNKWCNIPIECFNASNMVKLPCSEFYILPLPTYLSSWPQIDEVSSQNKFSSFSVLFLLLPSLVPPQSWFRLQPPLNRTRLPTRPKLVPLWTSTPPSLSLTFRSDWPMAAGWSRGSTIPTGDWLAVLSSTRWDWEPHVWPVFPSF